MRLLRLAFHACVNAALPALAALPLQPWLDTALPGASIRLPPGTYAGPAVISKPLTLDGDGKVIIDAGGHGTVLTIKADHVTLRGLTLHNSGDSHDQLDGGIMAEGSRTFTSMAAMSLLKTSCGISTAKKSRGSPINIGTSP